MAEDDSFDLPDDTPRPPVTLSVTGRPNARHAAYAERGAITLPRQPLMTEDDRVFTMGSCFAREIRFALAARGQTCLPRYRRIGFDPNEAYVDGLPGEGHMNFYNSFTIRQQIEQILGLWVQDPDDYWVAHRISRRIVPWAEGPGYQDPYRRLVVARTPETLKQVVAAIVEEMRVSFRKATAFVFTFGMCEVFLNKASGKAAAQKPLYGGGGGLEETTRHDSTFAENLENVREIVRLVRQAKPRAPIVVSVSPVPLARTFGPLDVVTASLEGKSILRAVLGQVVREFENVAYLPSYEFVMAHGRDGFRGDGRHVRPDLVQQIVAAFFDAFVTPTAAHAPAAA